MEDEKKFAEQMLTATFEFAKLAVSSLILLNAGAATALLAFVGSHGDSAWPTKYALLSFTVGAGLGGISSLLAYLGQRLDWAFATGRGNNKRATDVLIKTALACGVAGYLLFFTGCIAATTGIHNSVNGAQAAAQMSPNVASSSAAPGAEPRRSEPSWRNVVSDPNVFFTACVAVFTLALVVVGGWQGIQLKRTVATTKEAATALPAIERAYVFVRVFMHFAPNVADEARTQSQLTVYLKNDGRTPAMLRRLNGQARILEITAPLPTDIRSPIDFTIPDGIVLSPGEERQETIKYRVTAEEWREVENMTKKLICFGRIQYRDVLNVDRETSFCWEYQPHKDMQQFQIALNTPLNKIN